PGPITHPVSPTSIGGKFADGSLQFPLNGLVDDVQVSSQALTAGQVAASFIAARTLPYTQTAGSTNLSGGTLSSLVALQGGSLSGTGPVAPTPPNAPHPDPPPRPPTLPPP